MRHPCRPVLVVAVVCLLALGLAAVAQAENVTFTFTPGEGQSVQSVSLRGSMNDWGETPLAKGDDGVWRVTVDLAPGTYQYKYFVDGQWPQDMSTGLGGGPLDPDAGNYVDDGYGGKNAVRKVGSGAPEAPREPAAEQAAGTARIHYHRPDGDYAGWGVHVWEDSAEQGVTWQNPLKPVGQDDFGVFWDVKLKPDAKKLGFIVHKGDQKDPGPDMFLMLDEQGSEVWVVSGRDQLFTEPPDVARLALGDLSKSRAQWLDRRTMVWNIALREGDVVRLNAAPLGVLELTPEGVQGTEEFVLTPLPAGLTPALRSQYPHLAAYAAFEVVIDPARLAEILKGQIAVSVTGADGRLRDATGVQIPGVLDDLFYTERPLGVVWENGVPSLHVWAPTARSVKLQLFPAANAAAPAQFVDMVEDRGVWTAAGDASWDRMFYLYDVEVYVPATGRVEHNLVTDPYSRSLSMNSARSQIIRMDDPALMPEGWTTLGKPALAAPEDIVLYELHVRDFSASDPEVPEPLKGTFEAFTLDTPGTRHLRALAAAGLTHVHLMPSFDFATVNEDRSTWQSPGDLSGFPPDSPEQQAAVGAIRTEDGYNWGYDPYHYGVPEGSYSTDPDGPARVLEFRRMVQALSDMGLRVVMDVVYNHTNASGQSDRSVLDRIVPGYYHRLNADGAVETSTCCRNTATEHRMMGRLMVDDLVHWARDYKVDGFRFDLMGHHMRWNMIAAREALHALTPDADGVDGSKIYLYGEGWDFGEVGQGKRGTNAAQGNMAGTGIGTFNDRIRDAIRGGNPFNDRREQGFATGLFLDPNGFNASGRTERGRLLESMDRIRVGMAGNLAGYRFTDRNGNVIRGADLNYGGYTADPQETINYASAHDNETLYDKIQFAAPAAAAPYERDAMQALALAVVALGQGIPFFHAGSDMLRSKSMDADSYDSGDWFNRLDFTYGTDNFGVGLPPAEKNRDRWPLMKPLLERGELVAGPDRIAAAAGRFEALMRVRRSSPLFRLRTAQDIQDRVRFLNTGPAQIPGLVLMEILDEGDNRLNLDPDRSRILVVLNAAPKKLGIAFGPLKGTAYRRHPEFGPEAGRFVPETGLLEVGPRSALVLVLPEES